MYVPLLLDTKPRGLVSIDHVTTLTLVYVVRWPWPQPPHPPAQVGGAAGAIINECRPVNPPGFSGIIPEISLKKD